MNNGEVVHKLRGSRSLSFLPGFVRILQQTAEFAEEVQARRGERSTETKQANNIMIQLLIQVQLVVQGLVVQRRR